VIDLLQELNEHGHGVHGPRGIQRSKDGNLAPAAASSRLSLPVPRVAAHATAAAWVAGS